MGEVYPRGNKSPQRRWPPLYQMDEAAYMVFGNVDRDNGMFVSNRDLGDDDGQDQRDGGFSLDPLVFVQYMYTISISI